MALGSFQTGQSTPARFTPAYVISASGVNYPITSLASGLVEIKIDLDDAGYSGKLTPVRDVPSFTSVTLTSIGNWTFSPAKLANTPASSSIFADFVFNAGIYHPATIPLSQLTKIPSADPDGFAAPRVAAAYYADYAVNSIAEGTIVLDVTVSESGSVAEVHPVYTVPSLTKISVEAVKKWRFTPGTIRQTPVTSRAIVVFIYRAPNISGP